MVDAFLNCWVCNFFAIVDFVFRFRFVGEHAAERVTEAAITELAPCKVEFRLDGWVIEVGGICLWESGARGLDASHLSQQFLILSHVVFGDVHEFM